jgi:hypothetical protein
VLNPVRSGGRFAVWCVRAVILLGFAAYASVSAAYPGNVTLPQGDPDAVNGASGGYITS